MAENLIPAGFEVETSIPEGFEIETSLPEGFEVERTPIQNTTPDAQLYTGGDEELDAFAVSEQDKTMKLASTVFSAAELENIKQKPPMTFNELYEFEDSIPVYGSIEEGIELGRLAIISNKMQKGEEIDDSDKEYMDNYLRSDLERSIRGVGIGTQIALGLSQAPAFMTEFALSGGLASIAKKGVTSLVSKVAKEGVESAVEQTLKRKAVKFAGEAVGRSAIMAGIRGNAAYQQRRLNDSIGVTDKGEIILKESKESPYKTALKAFGDVSVEVVSEMTGGAIGKAGSTVIGGVSKPLRLAAERLPIALKRGLFETYRKIKPTAKMSNMLSSAGWHGMLEEMGEERVASVMRQALGLNDEKDYTFDNLIDALVPSKEQFLIEAGIFSIMGGSINAVNATVNTLVEKGSTPKEAKEIAENLTIGEQENMLQEMQQREIRASLEKVREKAFNLAEQAEIKPEEAEVWADIMQGNSLWASKQYNISPEKAYDAMNLTVESGKQLIEESDTHGTMVDNETIINTIETGDETSLLRDTSTLFRKQLVSLSEQSPEAKAQYDAILEWVGSKEGEFTADMEHQFAKGFEQYLKEGVAPSTKLKEAFISFRDWLTNIYRNMAGLDVHINSDVRKVFDEMLGGRELDQYTGEIKIDNSESTMGMMYRKLVNDRQPIEDLVNLAKQRGADIESGRNAAFLADLHMDVDSVTMNNLLNKTFYRKEDGQVEVTGESMQDILNDYDTQFSQFEQEYEQRHDDLKSYMIAERVLLDIQERDDLRKEAEEQGKLPEWERQISDAYETAGDLKEKYGDNYLYFESYADRVYGFQKRILYNLVRAGNMSEESYNSIIEKNPHYIPMNRVFNEFEIPKFTVGVGKGKFEGVSSRAVVKKLGVSAREVYDPFLSVYRNTTRIINAASKNDIARNVADMRYTMPEYIQKKKTPVEKVKTEVDGEIKTTYRPSGALPRGNVIEYYEDGKRQFIEVAKPLYDVMMGMQPKELNFVSKIFQGSANVFRAGATLTPEFMLRNPIRDYIQAFAFEGVTVVDMGKAVAQLVGKGALFEEAERAGAFFGSYMDLTDKSIQRSYDELTRPRGRMNRYIRSFGLEALRDAADFSEKTTRLATYIRKKKEGKSDILAAVATRDATLNFKRGGEWTKAANTYIPFLNAGVQGVDRLIRAFKNNPKAVAMRSVGALTMPQILLTGYYLFQAPDDEREEYLQIPQWQKDLYFNYKSGGEWIAIPKPFTLGYAFATVPERFMLWLYQGEKPEAENMFYDTVMGMAGSLTPVNDIGSLMPPLLRTTVENLSNYNFFTGRSIYPEYMDRWKPEDRFTKGTSETAKLVGEKLGVSPALIENATRGTVASTERYITDTGDWLIKEVKEWNGEKVAEKPERLSDKAVIRAFVRRRPSGYNAISTQNFYDKWNRIQQTHASYNKRQGSDRKEYLDENRQDIKAYKGMKVFSKQIRKLGKQIDAIYQNESMKAETKVKRIEKLEDSILEIAKKGNMHYNRLEQKGN